MKMKIRLPFLFLSLFFAFSLTAQTVVLDFEAPATSTQFQYFGSGLENTLNNIIANPDASGINTSAMVADFMKPAGAQTWAGGFTMPDPTVPVDVSGGNEICMKVWFANAGNVALKLEGGGASANWIQTQEVTETGAWTEICFDTNVASEEDPFTPAAGGTYTRIVLFFDFWNLSYRRSDLLL